MRCCQLSKSGFFGCKKSIFNELLLAHLCFDGARNVIMKNCKYLILVMIIKSIYGILKKVIKINKSQSEIGQLLRGLNFD